MAENWLEMFEKRPVTFHELANSEKCVISFELIEFQTRSAPQNDRVNLSFVKYIYVDGGKLTRNGRKTAMNS